MMNRQREIQSSKPKAERLYIGGEIEVRHLSEQGFAVYTLHRFDDYTRDENAAFDNYKG